MSSLGGRTLGLVLFRMGSKFNICSVGDQTPIPISIIKHALMCIDFIILLLLSQLLHLLLQGLDGRTLLLALSENWRIER